MAGSQRACVLSLPLINCTSSTINTSTDLNARLKAIMFLLLMNLLNIGKLLVSLFCDAESGSFKKTAATPPPKNKRCNCAVRYMPIYKVFAQFFNKVFHAVSTSKRFALWSLIMLSYIISFVWARSIITSIKSSAL